MADREMNRRHFTGAAAAAVGGLVTGTSNLLDAAPSKEPRVSRKSILNFNEKMEYRRLGKTGLMISAVCMGGHWKRIDKMVPGVFRDKSWLSADLDNTEFMKNRHQVVSRCIELGVNYIDACTGEEVVTYARALKGRRDKMYLGYSWYQKEPRRKEFRSVNKLIESLDEGLKTAGLDYVDLWRVTLPAEELPDLAELQRIEDATFGALAKAKKDGKVRFSGISTHNRPWLKSLIENYPNEMQVACTPYTAASKELPTDSVFAAFRKHNVGVFGIKPFADNSLFKGDGSLSSPHKEEDNQRARLALRYILGNPAITAPIPGITNIEQLENAVLAVTERRKLDKSEVSQLEQVSKEMWANLRPGYQWLRDWEYV